MLRSPSASAPAGGDSPAPVPGGDTGSCHPLSRAVGWGVPNQAGAGAECGDSSHRSRLGFLLSAGFGKAGFMAGLDDLGGLFLRDSVIPSARAPGVRHGLSWLLSSLVPGMVWYQLHLTSTDTEIKCKTSLFSATESSSAWHVS